MRWWLILSILGYATKAVPTIVDKALFYTKAVRHAGTYAVAVSMIGGLVILLGPFFLTWPSISSVEFALGSGLTFTLATWAFFSALKYSDASRVTPFMGAVLALTTAALAYFSLRERLAAAEVIAFLCLVTGGFLVTRGRTEGQGLRGRAISQALLAAILFSVSLVLSKAAFDRMPGAFLSAIIWMRIGSFATGLALLAMMPSLWRELRATSTQSVPKAKWAFLGGQASGAVSGLLIYGAVALGTPTLVNAMSGLEYLFVILYSMLVARYLPALVQERFIRRTMPILLGSVLLIAIGLALLVF